MLYDSLHGMVAMPKAVRASKGEFQDMCYELRTRHRLRHKEVAEVIGVKESTAGNLEYQRFKVISDEKASKLAEHYRLGAHTVPTRDAFMAASVALPLSEYTEKQRENWQKRNALRSKSKRFEAMLLAADSLVCQLAAEGRECTCTAPVPADFDAPARPAFVCSLCAIMQAMGIPEGYGSSLVALARIEKFQEARGRAAKEGSSGKA